jgi:hypothetical protein
LRSALRASVASAISSCEGWSALGLYVDPATDRKGRYRRVTGPPAKSGRARSARSDILDAFGADALIGPRIALKGDTTLNVFHSDLDRLSVEIDVNYVGALEKERMDADWPGSEDQIERLMESKGYAARHERGRQMDRAGAGRRIATSCGPQLRRPRSRGRSQ